MEIEDSVNITKEEQLHRLKHNIIQEFFYLLFFIIATIVFILGVIDAITGETPTWIVVIGTISCVLMVGCSSIMGGTIIFLLHDDIGKYRKLKETENKSNEKCTRKKRAKIENELVPIVQATVEKNSFYRTYDIIEITKQGVRGIAEDMAAILCTAGWNKDDGLEVPDSKKIEVPNETPIIAWDFSKKGKSQITVFAKDEDGMYIEYNSCKKQGYLILKDYVKSIKE